MVPAGRNLSTQAPGPAAAATEPDPRRPRFGVPALGVIQLGGGLALGLTPARFLAPARLVLSRARAILGQANLVEHQAGGEHQPERHQHERQVLAERPAEDHRAGDPEQNEQTGGADAGATRSPAHVAPPVLRTWLVVAVHVVR